MSYNSKKSIVSMAAGIILMVAYIIYALGDHAPAPDNVKAWAIAMLIIIGIGVAAIIVIMILFHIAFAIGVAAKEHIQGREPDENVERIIKSSMIEDERDKLVELKSNRIGQIFTGLGFVSALTALACGASPVIALHILFGAVALGALIGGGASIYYHERGV